MSFLCGECYTDYKNQPVLGNHSKNYYGVTALMSASKRGHLSCIQYLIMMRSSVHARDISYRTALMYASEYGHLDCVKCLIAAKSDVMAENMFEYDSLKYAMKNGHHNCVKYLIELKSEMSPEDHKKQLSHFWKYDSITSSPIISNSV